MTKDLCVTPLCPALGARVEGLQLNEPITAEVLPVLRQAFLEHVVLVFPRQDLEPDSQIAFTEHFGAVRSHPLNTRRHLEGHPGVLVLENRPGQRGARNDYWHSDISHMTDPPNVTVLHARTVPKGRGDTMFCNMYRAYDGLSAGMKAALGELRALHSGAATMRRSLDESTDARRLDPGEIPAPTSHPVVRTHPESGRPALFVNPHFTTQFEGLQHEESAPWLNMLYAAATRPENIYRHGWSEGDVVIWDNRCAMHYAVRDYDESMPRLMHRTTGFGLEA
ncbi:MAG: TauD/TfdA family dioxygenase [Gammaproteobacteria bacterium]|nr:TauD/TfdA family dioxygenase [Gammaproteobacteria bacterium]